MKARLTSFTCLAVLFSLLLTTPLPSVAAPAKDVVTITFWNGFTASDQPKLEAVVKQFNDTHANTQVAMDIMPWDTEYQKLIPSWTTGGDPDMAVIGYNLIPQYAESGLLLPLDDLYQNGLDPKKFSAGSMNGMQYKGINYGAPMLSFGYLLFYNKDMFKAAGLDPEKPPTTWAEWQSDNAALTKVNADGTPAQYGMVWGDHGAPNIWPTLIWGNGGDFVSADGKKSLLDDPKTIDAVKTWSDVLFTKGHAPLGLSGVEADQLIMSQKAAMEVSGPWMIGGLQDAKINFGIAQIPVGPAGKVTQGDGNYIVVSKTSKNKAAVYEFLKFWEDDWAQVYWTTHVGFPSPVLNLATNPDVQKNPFVTEFAKSGSSQRVYLPGLVPYTKLNDDIIMPAILEVARGIKPADVALKDAAAKMNDLLK